MEHNTRPKSWAPLPQCPPGGRCEVLIMQQGGGGGGRIFFFLNKIPSEIISSLVFFLGPIFSTGNSYSPCILDTLISWEDRVSKAGTRLPSSA